MPEAFTVTLNNSLTMSIVEHVDYGTGVVTYTVKGKRLSGAVTLSPCYSDNTETAPSRLWVESGRCSSESKQHDILTINGIPIDCRYSVDLEGKPTNPRNRHFQINRAGHYGWNDLPDATRRYAENVLEALTNLWIKRTDTDDLLRSAAQSNAPKRLSEEESRIQTLVIKLDEVRAELDASQERAAVYRKLQHEHQTALDDRNKAILAARVAAFDPTEGPRVGDYVCFADGVTRRISYVWPDDIQTLDDGSFYLGKGYMSFSGALYTLRR